MFTEEEIRYLQTQRLARIATVSSQGQPDVAPVGYEFDGEYFYIGGRDPANTLKYKNVKDGNTAVSLVVDDMESIDPWKPRGIKIKGQAEIVVRQGRFGAADYLRITPIKSRSWGILRPVFENGKFIVNIATKEN